MTILFTGRATAPNSSAVGSPHPVSPNRNKLAIVVRIITVAPNSLLLSWVTKRYGQGALNFCHDSSSLRLILELTGHYGNGSCNESHSQSKMFRRSAY